MPYLFCTIFGFGLIIGATTTFAYSVHEFLQIGNCASGPQPFEVALECPEGMGRLFLLAFGSWPVLGVGAWIHSERGRAPGSSREPARITLLIVWCAIFLGTAAGALWGVLGPDADPGGGTGTVAAARSAGIFVGILFVLMGLPALGLLIARVIEGGGDAARPAQSFQQSFQVPAAGSTRPEPPASGSPSEGEHDAELERLRRRLVDGDDQ